MISIPRVSTEILGLWKSYLYNNCRHIHSQHTVVPLAHTIFNNKNNQPDKSTPLILIHGLFGSKRNWESIARACSAQRKVIAVDCRNHGDSPSVPDMGYNVMAEDVESLMKEQKIGKAILLGHSMGGKVAMTLALNKPELVTKLIVEDVSPDVSRTSESTPYIKLILQAMQGIKFEKALSLPAMRRSLGQQLTDAIPMKSMRDFIITNLIQKDDGYAWQVNIDAIEKHLDELMGFPDTNLTNQGQTLFIGGTESEQIRDKHLPMISRFFPAAEVCYVQGSGHWVHAEKPREFIEIVQNFMHDGN